MDKYFIEIFPTFARQSFLVIAIFTKKTNADTFYHFVVADVLVTSGSNFPIAASIFRSLPQPTFSVMPKENSRSFYFMSEEILVDETGHLNDNVSKDDIMSQIHEYVRTKTKLFPLKQKSKLVKWIM